MQIDPEDFKRHYDSLSDEALLEINSDELVDVARECYEQELALRGLDIDSSPQRAITSDTGSPETRDDAQEHTSNGGLMVAATFLTFEEANLARGLLQSEEIPCSLENERGDMWSGGSALRLMVTEADYEKACDVLEMQISDEELAAQAEAELDEPEAEK